MSLTFALDTGSSTNSELTTMTLEEHNVLRSTKAGFCVYDSRGFRFGDPMDETLMELSQWTNEGVQHNQLCYISGDDFGLGSTSTPTRFVKRHVNCVMVVANMSFMYDCFKASHSSSLESTKLLFSYSALKTASEFYSFLLFIPSDFTSLFFWFIPIFMVCLVDGNKRW